MADVTGVPSAGSTELDSSDLAGQLLEAAEGAENNAEPQDVNATIRALDATPADEATEQAQETLEGEQQTTEATETTQAAPSTELAQYEEIEAALLEAGIDLPITAKDLPKEALPKYEQLLNGLIDVAQTTLTQQLEASQALNAVNAFSERLKEAPDKILLALAVNQPEVWGKVSKVVEEMQGDPRVKDLVLRELAVEAQRMEIQRQQQMSQEEVRRAKANQVIAATKRASRIHGVPFENAEKFVAMAVRANGGDLSVAEVDGIVKELNTANKAKVAASTKVITPQKVAATKTAPTVAVGDTQGQGGGAPVSRGPSVSKGLVDGTSEREGGGGRFRSIIKGINAKLGGQ
jgi:hypothetical protein